jgi:predicted patatin/cPLA2 family phospholipase
MSLHPVLQRVLARQHRQVPIADGRKIALILPGGVMAGIRGAGAMIALEDLGLQHAFDCIYANSAGFANASYLLAGATRVGTSLHYEALVQKHFIRPWRVWKIVDIDVLIEIMQREKRLPVEKILASHTQLYAALYETNQKKIAYMNIRDVPEEKYLDIMRATTSIPFLHPGAVGIHGRTYMDIPMWREVPHIAQAYADGCTDIVVIENFIHHHASAIASPTLCALEPEPSWKMSRFSTNTAELQNACRQMGRKIKSLFHEPGEIHLDYA